MSLETSILENYGGVARNNLLEKININMPDLEISNYNVQPSPYYTGDSFINTSELKFSQFSILSLNIQSLNSKYDTLITWLEQLRYLFFEFSAICLQETWLGEENDLALYQINNYSCISQGKFCSQHGGLVIYLHSNYTYELVFPVSSRPLTWEGLFIKIFNNGSGKHIYLGNIYRPPVYNTTNEHIQQFINEINLTLVNLNKSRSNIIWVGDFNIDLLKLQEKLIFRDFLLNMISHGLVPTLTLPTRIGDTSATLIDNVFSNFWERPQSTSSGIIITPISDHFPYFYSLSNATNYTKPNKYISYRKFNNDNVTKLRLELESLDIMHLLDNEETADPNTNYNIIQNIFKLALEKHMPVIKSKYNKYKHKKTNWITFGILRSIKFRDNMYRRLRQTPLNTIEYQNLKFNLLSYNKILKKVIREAKLKFYQSKFEKYKSNSKETWQTINEIINKKDTKTLPDFMIIENEKVTDKSVIANKFNDYFNNIGHQMAGAIDVKSDCSFKDYLQTRCFTTFSFECVSENYIKNTIKNLNSKSSSGHDEISTNLLKQLDILIEPLTLIVNQSLRTGIFPDKCKISKIIPIYKKNDAYCIENYRPISLLPSMSKIFEKVAFDQLFSYFRNNGYFFKNQYGFKKLHSTEHAILEVVDRITLDLDKGYTPLAIYLDLSKAFDTLDFNILLQKLQYYGIKDKALDWFHSYLHNRVQYVEFNHTVSKMANISLGVPQGSILGPLLYIIYTNDIQFSSKFFHFINYADDTTLLNSMAQVHDSAVVNTELKNVCDWLSANRLSLNIKKTKFMVFHNKNKKVDTIAFDIKVENMKIDRISAFNLLGITLDEHLNWNSHINVTSMKIARSVGILCKVKNILPE